MDERLRFVARVLEGEKMVAERAGSPRGYRLPEDRLDDPPVEDPRYSAYTQFIGLTQHGAYHAGQIVLLERAVQAERRRAAHDA